MKVDIENSIVIIDEAHNITDACEDALSKEISIRNLQYIENKLKQLYSMLPQKETYSLVSNRQSVRTIEKFVKALKK